MHAENVPHVRFELKISRQTDELLSRLAADDGSKPSQVMSKALTLFDVGHLSARPPTIWPSRSNRSP